MKKLILKQTPNLIFILFLFVGSILSFLYFQGEKQGYKEEILREFAIESENRYEVVKSRLVQRKVAINLIKNFFAASQEVSREEFSTFTKGVLSQYELESVCWVSSDKKKRYIVAKNKTTEQSCLSFNVTEMTRVFIGPKPQMMVSEFVSSRNGEKGFVSLVFDLRTLALEGNAELSEEFLILSDQFRNTLKGYSFSKKKIFETQETVSQNSLDYKYFPLEEFAEIQFLYLAELPEEVLAREKIRLLLVIAILIGFIFFVLGLFVRSIMRKKDEVSRLVELRTQELQRSNSELERFAYVVSHDLQAPLRHVMGFSNILLEDSKVKERIEEEDRETLDRIKNSTEWMQEMLKSLLHYSRVGREKIDREKVNLSDCLETVLEHLQYETREKNIELKVSPLPVVEGASTLLTQVFQNLISNAIKFSRTENGRIEVSYEEREGEYLISVKDNGIGFDGKFAESIFDVFRRLHRKEDYSGTGIGLSICQQIVRRHGGVIWAESKVGEGATFTFSLPKP